MFACGRFVESFVTRADFSSSEVQSMTGVTFYNRLRQAAFVAVFTAITTTQIHRGLGHEKAFEATPVQLAGPAPEGVGVPVGQVALDPQLLDSSAMLAHVLDGLSKRYLLVVFYKGGWCPSCNVQIHKFSKGYAEFHKRAVAIVAISVDKPEYGAKTAAEYGLPFPVLSDSDLLAPRAYRVVDHVNGFGAFMLARMGADLKARSGPEHHDVAIPALFLVDADRKVRWSHVDKDYAMRPSIALVLAAIDAVAPSAPSTPVPTPAGSGEAPR
jgi:peroxiredoxin